MATHSSTLAWKIPGTGEPGGLQSMVLQRVGHNRARMYHTYHRLGFILGGTILPRDCIKKQRHYVADKDPSSQSYGFSSSHILT